MALDTNGRFSTMTETSSQPKQVSAEETTRGPPGEAITSETQPREAVDGDEAAATGEDTGSAQTTDGSAPSDSDKPEKKRRDSRAERKIKRMARKLAEREAEVEAERKRATDLAAELEELREKVPRPEKPKLADYKDEDAFAEAYADWKAADKAPTKTTPAPKPSKPKPVATNEELETFHKKGTEKLGDAFLAASKDEALPVSQIMGEFILESGLGHEIYVHLSRHHAVAREMADETPVEAVRMLQALEAELANPKKKRGKTGDKTTSKAPPPGPDQETSTGGLGKDPNKMGMDEYARHRRKQERERP